MNNETQQTAVDWYISKIKEARNLCYDASMEMDIGHTLEVLIKKGEQAKEMEKERIEKAYDDAIMKGRQEDGEQYYEKTYGGNK
jgi:hypothetical protein